MIFPMTLHPVAVRSVLPGVAVIRIILPVAHIAGVPWSEECVVDSLVGVVEAGLRCDDLNTCLFNRAVICCRREGSRLSWSMLVTTRALIPLARGAVLRSRTRPSRSSDWSRMCPMIWHPVARAIRSHSARSASTCLWCRAGQAGVENDSHSRTPNSRVSEPRPVRSAFIRMRCAANS